MPSLFSQWKGGGDFLKAQGQVAIILLVAYVGNNWPNSYPRNDNVNPTAFWIMNAILAVAGLLTLRHEPSNNPNHAGKVTLLNRAQTEEWKGMMQWAFIMYHYYRAFFAYNEIRVFVSAYVWMTGFGNFLYFDKKHDYSLDRMVSMWLRINYFPLMLSTFLTVPLELYYVVPLHTIGFFVTMATCWVSRQFELKMGWNYWPSRCAGVFVSLLVHVLFYETDLKDVLLLLGQEGSQEYHFRFQADKYTAWVGILSGMMWKQISDLASKHYGSGVPNPVASWLQRGAGVALIYAWYLGFGHIADKLTYNPMHPYIFWMPLTGWLMIRNSSKYLCELHSTALEFIGRITLETYVLQFHVFMCQNVQHIPIVIPGSGPDGSDIVRFANMALCGVLFVSLALWARKVTVTTQTAMVELLGLLRNGPPAAVASAKENGKAILHSTSTVALSESQHGGANGDAIPSEEMASFVGRNTGGGSVEMRTKEQV
jgi:hypothetical protein